ncbi:Nop13p ASCRUDRAFT_26051, partial [Ascoidea rubescens DSM 1968]
NARFNKGFAYIDVSSEEMVENMLRLNESELLNRNLLIKNGDDYNGRPKVALKEGDGEKEGGGKQESHILFIGNLSFETLGSDIETLYLKYTDQINKIRMGTFQDLNKCKGWCFVDFKTVESCKEALSDKQCKYLLGRKLRLEYGEDRSKRRPQRQQQQQQHPGPVERAAAAASAAPTPAPARATPRPKQPRPKVRSSVALATAQRASAAIVPATGKKIRF